MFDGIYCNYLIIFIANMVNILRQYQNIYSEAMCKHALVIFQSCNLPRCKISIYLYWTQTQGDAVILVTASVRTLAMLVQGPEAEELFLGEINPVAY